MPLDQSIHLGLNIEHFGVLVCLEVVSVVQLPRGDLHELEWDVDPGESLGPELGGLHFWHRGDTFLGELEGPREVGERLGVEGLHGAVLRVGVSRNFFLFINTPCLINLLEPLLEVFVLEEVGIGFCPEGEFVGLLEYAFVVMAIGRLEIEDFSALPALFLLVLDQRLADIEPPLPLGPWELIVGPQRRGNSRVERGEPLPLSHVERVDLELLLHLLEFGREHDLLPASQVIIEALSL